MTEHSSRMVEIIEELRAEQERRREGTRAAAGLEAAETEQARAMREETERYWRERAEELLDALNPQERRTEEEDEAPRERTGPDGLAVMVGHSKDRHGALALSPPFPPELGREEYHWNSDLARRIKDIADKNGIRCRIFFRDGFEIASSYGPVRAWGPRASVELHFNSTDNPSVEGTETWYGDASSFAWAAKLQAKMVKLYGRKGGADRGTKDARAIPPHRALTATTQIHPSALIEPFFALNLDDCQMAVDRKTGLARAIVEAYAELVGIALPADGAVAAPSEPAPKPVPVAADASAPAAGAAAIVANPSGPVAGLPESELFANLRQLYLRPENSIAHPGLKFVTLGQWALESSWGTSGLAAQHFNFAGMKGIAEVGHLSDIASVVDYQAHDGRDRYLRFASLQNFIAGYWRFLERSPYRGWKEHTADERDFIAFIASKWAPADRHYVTKVMDIAIRLRRALTQAAAGRQPLAAAGGAAPAAGDTAAPPAEPRLSPAAIPADAPEFRKLFETVTGMPLEHPALQGAVLAQCAIESNWGRSELARAHYNFAGTEWSDALADVAVPVDYQRGDGTVGKYCRFLDHQSFLKGYLARLEREPRFSGWKEKANDAEAFIAHVAPLWRPEVPDYGKTVLGALARLTRRAAAPSSPATASAPATKPATKPAQVALSPGQLPDGYVIRIKRRRVEHRPGAGTRTVGDYDVFFRGQKVRGLEGMVFEAHGPGDNTATGTADHRRLEAKVYPLGTHVSPGPFPKYATHGYTPSTAAFATARPSIRLDNTGYRQGVLFHPGGGFLSSIGCLNFSRPLSGPADNIDYTDSRTRVVAVIEDMRARLGDEFPFFAWKTIPNAWMAIEGEPGAERGREAIADRFEQVFDPALTPEQRVAAAREAAGGAVADADPARLFALAAAAMNGGGLPERINLELLRTLVSAGADLASLRGENGDNLWSAWADGIVVAAGIEDPAERARLERELGQIATLLEQAAVAIDNGGGLHTALIRAAIGNRGAAVAALLAQGARLDGRDRHGLTPLIAAAFFAAADSVDVLLRKGANRSAKVAAPAAAAEPGRETYSELPGEGRSALEAAEYGRSLVLYAPDRDASYERIVAALTQP